MKPVETGGGDDALRLRAAAGDTYPLTLVRPFAFDEPLAPIVAARRAGQAVDITILHAAFAELQRTSDAIVVEGAGGLLVPITETDTFATLFKRWDVELIVVAANRLGAINHTMLTLECAQTHGIPVRGVVLNTVSPEPPGIAEETNLELLRELAGVPVVDLPYGGTVTELARRLVRFLHA
jgi:dethiobiotin synthetase